MSFKKILILLFSISLSFALLACWGPPEVGADATINIDSIESNKYAMIVEGYDWGPSVPKIIANLGKTVIAADVNAAAFTVTVEYAGWTGPATSQRTIKDAYVSDINGNKVTKNSQYVTIDMAVHPGLEPGCNPFVLMFPAFRNVWGDPYNYTIVSESLGVNITERDKKVMPLADHFVNTKTFTYDTITMHYGFYSPAVDYGKNPLIIWLHGGGEGGTDLYIAELAGKVTNLITKDIQKYFGGSGAYVLVPQSPTLWMDDGTGNMTTDGTAVYLESLKALIDDFVSKNKDIDKSRIYIGGCSNGGFMTMKLIMAYPKYFAAAFPICEVYQDSWITDDNITSIKNIPIWFTHAATDPVVNPAIYTIPTYERLIAAGAKNVHFSYFAKVADTSGLYFQADGVTPYEYFGHMSWKNTLNNECELDYDGSPVQICGKNVTIMKWLAAQSKCKH